MTEEMETIQWIPSGGCLVFTTIGVNTVSRWNIQRDGWGWLALENPGDRFVKAKTLRGLVKKLGGKL